MNREHLTFTGPDGVELAATIDLPDGAPRGWVLFGHCYTCGRKSPAAARICKRLVEHGYATFRFDFTGVGDSEGAAPPYPLDGNTADLRAAAAFLAETGRAPSLLVGHSLGGAAAIQAAPDIDSLKAVVAIGAPKVARVETRLPLLVLHTPTDQVVGIMNAVDNFAQARFPKALVSLDGVDHLLTADGAAAHAADVISTWAEPYLHGNM
ncbi:alpha/beta fold hydrolase [Corynebacterium sp. TAE3-ERU12]|uniref:alpha/beta fold hydrolase n=1 Tax=Corynebacterium sp. TAE3-ERU12 TaxID=2849491 RepID=UPI001C4558A4|nr:alpha/beta fold hydrolase [Corynebacterium sp. TAE3-ERU12]MBV7295629.1 alpha/beta fold hydrolase [Corynebacterium sp. TAE3-ERU12]